MIQGAVFSGWTRASFAGTGVGLSLYGSAFTLEIGSSFGVYCHYFGIKLKTVVRSGRPNLRKFHFGAGNETLTRGLILGKDAL